jgi:hypothetical protein
MDLFGQNLTFNERAGLIVVTFLCFSLLLWFIKQSILKGRPFKLSMFGSEVDVEDASGLNDAGKSAIMDVLAMTAVTATKTSTLKTKTVLSDQMYYLEDKLILIQEILTTAYRASLSDGLAKEHSAESTATVYSHKEYHFFTSLVTLLIEDMKRSCRQIFIKNNFSHFNEREFSEYADEKVTLLQAKALQFIRDLYPSDKMIVPFETLEQEVFKKNADATGSHLEHALRKAVQIYKARHEEADALDKELRDYILDTYGVDVDAPRKSREKTEGKHEH